jgi:hypothetical protein
LTQEEQKKVIKEMITVYIHDVWIDTDMFVFLLNKLISYRLYPALTHSCYICFLI